MRICLLWVLLSFVFGCSPAKRLAHDLQTKPIYTDHFTGVALYDPAKQRVLIQHNADKPFVPASNTKLVSFYAGLTFLPDSLPALRYLIRNDSLIFWGTGNPLLLHPDLPDTSVLAFLRNRSEKLFFSPVNYSGPRFGPGWAWDDYSDDYSPELSVLPIYGNVVRFRNAAISPRQFADSVQMAPNNVVISGIRRAEYANQFLRAAESKPMRQDVPFRWSPKLAVRLLGDTLRRPVSILNMPLPASTTLLRGTPTDSLYKRMLHVSDNQFAEQLLFMVSAERNNLELSPNVIRNKLIDSVLHYSKATARWVDGSGLSRYNLFTPNVLIDLLGRIHAKVPQQRLFALLSAMGQIGPSRSLAVSSKPYVFAKSGSMTGVYNLSGYIRTKRNKVLYFSIMHNNFTQTVSEMRQRTADLLREIHARF